MSSNSHFISLDKAREMITRYRDQKENILKSAYEGQNILLTCETFDREAFDALLAQEGCVKIRTYFGMNADLKVRVIAFGVNEKNENMLPSGASVTDGDGNHIVEEGLPCPDFCPPPFPE